MYIEIIIDMNGLFFSCSSLKSLPDISKWNSNNVKKLFAIFLDCPSLLSLPDISIMYKINEEEVKFSLGFFCHIKNKNKKIPIVVINNYIFDEDHKDIINVHLNDEVKEIKLGNTKYRNKEFNISMIEIKEEEKYNFNYLELDDNLLKDDTKLDHYKESIYIINYGKNNFVFVLYGLINNLTK